VRQDRVEHTAPLRTMAAGVHAACSPTTLLLQVCCSNAVAASGACGARAEAGRRW